MQACTTANIDAYVNACGPSDYSPECLAWKADPMNATCKACVLRTDHSGPLLFYPDGTTVSEPNEGACLAAGGAPDCGAATDASYTCMFDACGSCPLGDGGDPDAAAVTGACYETVYMGDCKKYTDAQAACESTLTGPVVDCEATTGTFASQIAKAITLLCGIPGDGGASDSGASDSGANDSGEGGASDAAPGDAAHE
jgi:hypothetical protein